jgi:hypothetical protein
MRFIAMTVPPGWGSGQYAPYPVGKPDFGGLAEEGF